MRAWSLHPYGAEKTIYPIPIWLIDVTVMLSLPPFRLATGWELLMPVQTFCPCTLLYGGTSFFPRGAALLLFPLVVVRVL
jgi:hypothetical protein